MVALLQAEVLFQSECGDWVVVREDPETGEPKGGIKLVPGFGGKVSVEDDSERISCGTVVAAGPGRQLANGTHESMPCSGGDRVAMHKMGVIPIQKDRERGDLVAISAKSIIGVVK